MSSIPNNIAKKKNTLGKKPIKKSIQININSNPAPNKFLFSNQVNNIASSYLSMGRRIQINKNNKTSKIIHENTNSAANYNALNSKDIKKTNGSITNIILNNLLNNNKTEINSINVNNYIHINNINNLNNNANNHSQQQTINLNRNNNNINIINKKQLSTLSNSHISRDLLINDLQTSKINLNSTRFKNELNNN